MKDFWIKNKFTVISMIFYSIIVLLFGDISGYKSFLFIMFIFLLPLVQNLKIDSGSIWRNIIAGLLFGIMITPFNFTSINGTIFQVISYWSLILGLNLFFVIHQNQYRIRESRSDLSDKREEKLERILNPISRRFFL